MSLVSTLASCAQPERIVVRTITKPVVVREPAPQCPRDTRQCPDKPPLPCPPLPPQGCNNIQDEAACKAEKRCRWTADYKRKDGTSVSAYCSRIPAKWCEPEGGN